jgi:hypothetical protein
LSYTSGNSHIIPRCTFTELIMIFGLLEIFIPDLCLFLFINGLIKFYNSSRCVCWFSRLVLDQSMCRRKFGSSTVIFIFICINPFIAS